MISSNKSMLKLGIIGAGYLQVPLVQKAKAMGIYTICFAWEEGAVCRDICDEFFPVSILEKEKILDLCKEKQIDGVVSIASDVAVPTVNYIANKLSLTGNSDRSSLLSTNKYAMRNAFREQQLLIPDYFEFTDEKDLTRADSMRYPLIVKPVDRSGSRGVLFVRDKNELRSAVAYAKKESFSGKVIVEEFISGKEISVEAISWQGKHHILTYTDKVTSGFPYFVELEHHQPSIFNTEKFYEKIQSVVVQGLNSLEIENGASHAELIITDNGRIYLNEIGARMGGDFIGSDLVELSTGYDFLKGVIEISLGKFTAPVIQNKAYSGVHFYTKDRMRVKEYIDLGGQGIVKYEIDNHVNSEIKKSADRNGYFIYKYHEKIEL